MGDMGDIFNAHREHRKMLREKYGIECPRCKEKRPRACPTILLLGQKCFDGYRDPRPRLKENTHEHTTPT